AERPGLPAIRQRPYRSLLRSSCLPTLRPKREYGFNCANENSRVQIDDAALCENSHAFQSVSACANARINNCWENARAPTFFAFRMLPISNLRYFHAFDRRGNCRFSVSVNAAHLSCEPFSILLHLVSLECFARAKKRSMVISLRASRRCRDIACGTTDVLS